MDYAENSNEIQTAERETQHGSTGIFKMPVASSSSALKKKSADVAVAFADSDLLKPDTQLNAATISDTPNSAPDYLLSPNTVSSRNGTASSKGVKQKSSSKSYSPAEQLKDSEAVIPYKEPSWGGITDKSYYFEVIKNGAVMDRVELNAKSFYVFGRLPSCDHSMDHPSLSRYHAVIQHCSKTNLEGHDLGWYLYDLDSTHGTWINKSRIFPHVYHRLRVGYVVKFGGSTRLYILQVCKLLFVSRVIPER